MRTLMGYGLAAAALLVALADSALGQPCPASGWLPGTGVPGLDGTVAASAVWDPDGPGPIGERLIFGGSFDQVGNQVVSGVAGWDGAAWSTFNGSVATSSLAVFDGQIIAGGNPARRWTGTTWEALDGAAGMDLRKLLVVDGQLFGGGQFPDPLHSPTTNTVARWTGESWEVIGRVEGTIAALGQCRRQLVVAGSFATMNGSPARSIALWDGAAWHALGDGLGVGVSTGVSALAEFDGHLIAGGASASGAPWIARSADPQRIAHGGAASFDVEVAGGYEPLTYRWRRNGRPLADGPATASQAGISGSSTSTLTLSGVRVFYAGEYDCLVTGACGDVLSRPATLGVTHDCPADCNGDGDVNCDDLGDFITAYFAPEPREALVEFNGDGEMNADDLGDFITAYFAGCP